MINIILLIISFSFLIPNHYPPWTSAWNEGMAIVGVFFLIIYIASENWKKTPISWHLTTIAGLCLSTIWVQNFNGKILFSGDAFVASMYIGIWFLAVLAGSFLASPTNSHSNPMNAMTASWSGVAMVSVGIALAQWTGALSLGIYAADLPPSARPFGNLAQPNHFSTLCFLGLCGLLWLRQQNIIQGVAFWLAAAFLLWGMVMSQSRTGWVQMFFLVAWGLAMRNRASLCLSRLQFLLLGTMFVAGVVLWPVASEALFLSPGRGLDEKMSAGIRLPYWWAMLDALSHELWWGYGWEQVGMAQHRIALDHSPMGTYFQYSHNFIIDLLLWNGTVVGGFLVFVICWWFISHIFSCQNANVTLLLAALAGIFIHGLLEYPLAYAYFLIPVGIIMGAVDRLSSVSKVAISFPRWSVMLGALSCSALFIIAAIDYIKVEENYRLQRMEIARIGVEGLTTPVPNIYLLTQMEALLQVEHLKVNSDMGDAQIQWLHKVSLRFSYPTVLLRYAEALALNGKSEEATHQIRLLRRIWNPSVFKNIKTQLALSKNPEIRKLASVEEN